MLDKRKSRRVTILVEGEKRREMTENADSLDNRHIAEALLEVDKGIRVCGLLKPCIDYRTL
jgi:hypothetical protein